MLDMVVALLLLAALSGMVAVSTSWSQRAAEHLGDSRAASDLAESALLDLAQGRPAPAGVTVEPVAPGAPVPEHRLPEHRWVRVTAVIHGRSAVLIGLAKGAQ